MTAQSADGVLDSLAEKDGNTLRSAYGDASVQGFKGTLLPEAAGSEGASMGFSAEELLPINIDPDYAGGYTLMPGQVQSKERIRPMPASGYNKPETRRLASEVLKTAASVQVKEEPSMSAQQPTPAAPAAVAPPIVAPVRRRRPAPAAPPPPPVVQPEPVKDFTGQMPTKRVSFDFGPPFGEMETFFHTVIREGNNLVLGWDMACRNAQRYKPSVSQTPITVRVGGNEYQCMSLGISFADEETQMQYVVLLIDMRKGGAQ